MQFVLHSYSFRNYPLVEVFRCARRFGWDAIELHPVHFDSANPQEALDAARVLAQQYGVDIACVDFSGDFIGSADDAQRSVAEVEGLVHACGDHGIHLINGFTGWLVSDPDDWGKNGSAIAEESHYRLAAEALQRLASVAESHGVQIGLEIHMNTIHDTIASAAQLLGAVGRENVVATVDPGNMFAVAGAEKDPASLDQLAGHIGHVHLKNCVRRDGGYDYGVRLAQGHIDLHSWLLKLVKMGYEGPIAVEHCGEGDPHVSAEEDLPYVRKALAWISEALE